MSVQQGLLLSLLCCCISMSALGQVLAVPAYKETMELNSHLYEWEETHSIQEQKSVPKALQNIDWRLMTGGYNKGYIGDAYWYRLKLTPNSSVTLLRLLEITYPLLDRIDVYITHNQESVTHYSTGDRRDYSHRPIHGRTFVFPIELQPGQVSDIYFRVQSASSHQINTRLWSTDAYIKYSNEDATYRAAYYGSQLMLIVFILGLYALMRERLYLLFSITIFGLLTLQAALHGVFIGFYFTLSRSNNSRRRVVCAGYAANAVDGYSSVVQRNKNSPAFHFVVGRLIDRLFDDDIESAGCFVGSWGSSIQYSIGCKHSVSINGLCTSGPV